MAKALKFDAEGRKAGEVDLDPRVFEARILEQAVFESVLRQLANKRRARPKTKTRSEVRGGGRKPWRQKGTGRARAGSTRSGLWRGGGIILGPDGRQNHTYGLPKKVRRGALRSILTQRARTGQVKVLEAPTYEAPKTKQIVSLLANMELTEAKVLFIMDEREPNFERSVRNLPHAKALPAGLLNPHDLLKYQELVFFEKAVPTVVEVLA